MRLSGYDQLLWLAGLIASVVLLVVLYARRRILAYPLFKAFIALDVIRTVALFLIHRKVVEDASYYSAYYYTYLYFALVDNLLQVGIAYEIGFHVFRPAGRWSPGSKKVFLFFTTAALLVSVFVGWLLLPPTDYLSDTLLLRSNFSSAALVSELFVCILFFSVHFGLPWKTYAARLAQGLGTFCAVGLVSETLKTYLWLQSGTSAYRTVTRVRAALYFVTLVFWIVTLTRTAPVETELPEPLQRQLLALSRSTATLMHLLSGRRSA